MTTLKSLTGRTVVEASVSPIGEVHIDVRRNDQTVERLAYGREQDLNRTMRLELTKAGDSVQVFEQGPDGERLVTTIPVAGYEAPKHK